MPDGDVVISEVVEQPDSVPDDVSNEVPPTSPDAATADDVASIVNDAIDSAVARVGEAVASSDAQVVEQMRGVVEGAKAGETTSTVVEITSVQWEFLTNELRLYSTMSLFTLLMLAVVVGVALCKYFVKGWRK